MKNNTVSLDDETRHLAHVRATEAGMSVSALVCAYLNGLAADRGGKVAAANEPDAEGEREPELGRRRRRLDELYDEAINGPDAIWT